MQLPDVNVLIHAHREDAAEHDRYAARLLALTAADEPFALSEVVLAGFLRRFFALPDVLLGVVRFARRGGAIPPLLIGEEDGRETDRYRDADGHGDCDVIAAEAVHKQGDT